MDALGAATHLAAHSTESVLLDPAAAIQFLRCAAARLLKEVWDLSGTVLVVIQPAEEARGGGNLIINSGILLIR